MGNKKKQRSPTSKQWFVPRTGCRHHYGIAVCMYDTESYGIVRYNHDTYKPQWDCAAPPSHTKLASRLLKLCPVADLGWNDKRIHLPRIWNFHCKRHKLHNPRIWKVSHWIFGGKFSHPIFFCQPREKVNLPLFGHSSRPTGMM